MNQKIIISQKISTELAAAIAQYEHDRLFVLTDENTLRLCWPLVKDLDCMQTAQMITIGATDTHKDIESLSTVWKALGDGGGTRHSLLVNLGGGMITDLGGFAASTFKRGIQFINLPTTLLSMVDASVGGKTGINFNGLKNEVGVFNNSMVTILDTCFLKTSDEENILSGYAEMIKHGLISDKDHWAQLLSYDISSPDFNTLRPILSKSVGIKENVVNTDPHEKGIRKSLNLGHTFGHAFESWALKRKPVLHGYAVAYGLACELYCSVVKCGLDVSVMRQTNNFIREHYGTINFTCDDYDELIALMMHDKKNRAGHILAALLAAIGEIKLDVELTENDIKAALDFYREGE